MHVCHGSGRNGDNQQDCGALYLLYHWFHWQTAQTALARAQNAYARALVERGEDGGLSSSEAYLLYKAMLSDYIALEGTRYPENQEFVAV